MHARIVLIAVAVAVVAAFAAPLAAQQRDSVQVLPPLIVTAERMPTPPERVVASTTVISGDEIRARGVRFVQDALRDVPGAAVVQQGSFGGTTSLFLRGGESRYVKVLIDGVAVNQPGGYYDFSSLTTDNVERIEVVRGPASVLYGSDAMTGVVQIFTRRGAPGAHLRAGGEGGSFGSFRGSLSADGGSERLGGSASISRIRSEGIYDFNSQYGNTVGSGLLRAKLGASGDLALTARVSDNTSHFPTDFAGRPADSTQLNHERSITVGLDAGTRLGRRAGVRVALASHDADGGYATDRNPFGPPSSRADYDLWRRSADARVNFEPVAGNVLTVGASGEFEHYEPTSFSFTPGLNDTTVSPGLDSTGRHTVSGYAQALLQPLPALTVNAGGRADDNSAFGTFWTYRAGAAYVLPSATRIRASVGRAFKAPALNEIFANSDFERGRRDLRPERSVTWDAGVEQTFGRGLAVVGVTYFNTRFRDLVAYEFTAPPEPTYRNVNAARAYGVEATADVALPRSLRLAAQYTWLRTRVTDAGGNSSPASTIAEGQPLVRRPRHSGRVGLRYLGVRRATLALNVNLVGTRDDIDFDAFERVVLPSYATVDASARFEVLPRRPGSPSVTLTVRAENLFDERYAPVFGYQSPGRGIYGGAEVGL